MRYVKGCWNPKSGADAGDSEALIGMNQGDGYGAVVNDAEALPEAPKTYSAKRALTIFGKAFWLLGVTPFSAVLFAVLAAAKKEDTLGQAVNFVSSFSVNAFNNIVFGARTAARAGMGKQYLSRLRASTPLEKYYLLCFLLSFGCVVFTAAVGWELGGDSVDELDNPKVAYGIRLCGKWSQSASGKIFAQAIMSAITFVTRFVGMQGILYELGVIMHHGYRSLRSAKFHALCALAQDVASNGPGMMADMVGESHDSLKDFAVAFYSKKMQKPGYYAAIAQSKEMSARAMDVAKTALKYVTLFGLGVLGFLQAGWMNMIVAEKGLQKMGMEHPTLTAIYFAALSSAMFVLFTNLRFVPRAYQLLRTAIHAIHNRETDRPSIGLAIALLSAFGLAVGAAWFSGAGYYFVGEHYSDLVMNGPAEGGLDVPVMRNFLLHQSNPFAWVFKGIPVEVAANLMQGWAAIANLYGVMNVMIRYCEKRLRAQYPNNPVTKYGAVLSAFSVGDLQLGQESSSGVLLDAGGLDSVDTGKEKSNRSCLWCVGGSQPDADQYAFEMEEGVVDGESAALFETSRF